MEQLNSSAVTSNISSSPGHPPPASWDSRGLVPAVVLSVCFLLGVPGNIAVIILRPNWENMAYVVLCSIYCSMQTVTVLSIQRYLQVVRLQKFLDQRGRRRLLVLLWLVAISLSISRLVVLQLTTDKHWTHCQSSFSSEAQQVAVQLTETLIGFISISVVAFSYIGLHRTVDQAAFFNNPQTTRLVTIIIVTFFVLWMPYHIINVLGVAGVLLKSEGLLKFFGDSRSIAAALTFVNSCLNPLLYAFASRNMCTVCQQREH
ncbi:leukotriene B4 receptor 1-like [Epinephelus lanceolatus]